VKEIYEDEKSHLNQKINSLKEEKHKLVTEKESNHKVAKESFKEANNLFECSV
jgi:hypothetical protein